MGWRSPAAPSCLGCKRSAVPGRGCSLANDQGHNNSTEEAHRVTGGTAFHVSVPASPVPRSVKSAGLCLQPATLAPAGTGFVWFTFPKLRPLCFPCLFLLLPMLEAALVLPLLFPEGIAPQQQIPTGFHFKGLSLKSSLMFL